MARKKTAKKKRTKTEKAIPERIIRRIDPDSVVEDQIPLPGVLQIVLIEVAGQGLALDFVGHCGNLSEPADTTNARRLGPVPGALLGA